MIERKTADNTMPENTSTLLDFSNFVFKYDNAFYELIRLLQIACTMPVTSLTSERSSSCLQLIKTHLRTKMLDERLSSLAVLLMHSERVNELDFEKVIGLHFSIQVCTLPHSVNTINTLIGRLFHSSSFTLSECIDRTAKLFSFLLLSLRDHFFMFNLCLRLLNTQSCLPTGTQAASSCVGVNYCKY